MSGTSIIAQFSMPLTVYTVSGIKTTFVYLVYFRIVHHVSYCVLFATFRTFTSKMFQEYQVHYKFRHT